MTVLGFHRAAVPFGKAAPSGGTRSYLRSRWIVLTTFTLTFLLLCGGLLRKHITGSIGPAHHSHSSGLSDVSGVAPAAANGTDAAAAGADTIPNLVNFVYVLAEPNGDLNFVFRHYLCMYAAWFHWRPDAIYLHTNADDDSIARARRGDNGKWARAVLEMPGLVLNRVDVPTHAGNGVKLSGMEHRSDFVRVRAVDEFGGIYIDFDVLALRDVAPLRRSGFRGVGGREITGQLNSGTFMAAKHSLMTTMWIRTMNEVYDGGWTTHSNQALTDVAIELIRSRPGEMLILERESFAPGGWDKGQNIELFGLHRQTPSPLVGLDWRSGPVDLPEHGVDDGPHEKDRPDWARSWAATYLLHAFKPSRNDNPVPDFTHIDPMYVLNRQSNYARAAYPVVRDMYKRGLVNIDDTYDGR